MCSGKRHLPHGVHSARFPFEVPNDLRAISTFSSVTLPRPFGFLERHALQMPGQASPPPPPHLPPVVCSAGSLQVSE